MGSLALHNSTETGLARPLTLRMHDATNREDMPRWHVLKSRIFVPAQCTTMETTAADAPELARHTVAHGMTYLEQDCSAR
jgi:hypothetical protein